VWHLVAFSLLPVRRPAIIFVDLQGKLTVIWARPVILVKPRGLFKQFPVHIEDELPIMGRELHCVPGDGEPFVPKAHEASKRKYRIGDPPLFQVNSIAGDCSQPLSIYIDDIVTRQVAY
jgi:hypothetical protein